MKFSLAEIDPSWRDFFAPYIPAIEEIFAELSESEITPNPRQIFRAFRTPLEEIKVVIFGQDPYPKGGVANGLAFSVNADAPIPASLRNIFKEYCEDLNFAPPQSGDLAPWSEQGVLLLNRVLTTETGKTNAHRTSKWSHFTDDVAKFLGQRDVVAILWGSNAAELAIHFRDPIISVHPSPLSAYRGFFGSKPFSKANELLRLRGIAPVDWMLN